MKIAKCGSGMGIFPAALYMFNLRSGSYFENIPEQDGSHLNFRCGSGRANEFKLCTLGCSLNFSCGSGTGLSSTHDYISNKFICGLCITDEPILFISNFKLGGRTGYYTVGSRAGHGYGSGDGGLVILVYRCSSCRTGSCIGSPFTHDYVFNKDKVCLNLRDRLGIFDESRTLLFSYYFYVQSPVNVPDPVFHFRYKGPAIALSGILSFLISCYNLKLLTSAYYFNVQSSLIVPDPVSLFSYKEPALVLSG